MQFDVKRRGWTLDGRNQERTWKWKIYTDGAIRPDRRASGLAAIVRDEHNRICFWWLRRAGALTCNEAEYAAAIFALEKLLRRGNPQKDTQLEIYSDSRVLVDQMSGRAEARAPSLAKAQARLQALVERFACVTFHHISREQNRLADALAFEAVEGHPQESLPRQRKPNQELWNQFISNWRVE